MNGSILLTLILAAAPAEPADLVIKDVMIFDGTGQPGYVGNLAVKGDTLIGIKWKGKARKTINGKGLVAAPGFIDLHSHSDNPVTQLEQSPILDPGTRDNYNFTTQGCTTIVTGNCGGGVVDVAKFFAQLDRNGAGTNVIHLLPHGAIRRQVFGSLDRPPTEKELARMKALVQKGMQAGA